MYDLISETSELAEPFDAEAVERFEHLVRCLTPIADIAVLMDIPETVLRMLIEEAESPVGKIYRRVRAETALKVRERNLELADAGSPTAAEKVAEDLKKMMLDL